MICVLGRVLLLGVTVAGVSDRPSPPAWSPDGEWLGFVATAGATDGDRGPRWLIPATLAAKPLLGPETAADPHMRSKLWVSRTDGETSVLLEDVEGVLGAPGWHPEGTSMAFVRLTTDPEGGSREELVVRSGMGQVRVLQSRWADVNVVESEPELRQPSRWSPDGRMIFAPTVGPSGIQLVQADTGAVIASLENARLASWSPDSQAVAFFREDGPGLWSICRYRLETREVEVLGDASFPIQAPHWGSDGRTLLFVDCPRATDGTAQAVLVGVGDQAPRRAVLKTIENPLLPSQTYLGSSFALDRRGVEQYYVVLVGQRTCAISHHRGRAPLDRYHPLDESMRISALTLSPAEDRLAVRVGPPGEATMAWIELSTKQLRPVVPDDSAWAAWMALYVRTMLDLLNPAEVMGLAAPSANPRRPLPTSLPLPDDLSTRDRTQFRLRELKKRAREALSDTPEAMRSSRLEMVSRLVISYLDAEYDTAIRELSRLDPLVSEPDLRLRLLGLRVQLECLAGREETAVARLQYLSSLYPPLGFDPTDPSQGGVGPASPHEEHALWIEELGQFLEERTDRLDASAPVLPEPRVERR